MNVRFTLAGWSGLALLALGGLAAPRAAAQDPIITPIIVSEAAPIVAKVLTPKPKNTGLEKFEGYVMNANLAQITVYYDPQSKQAVKLKGKPSKAQ